MEVDSSEPFVVRDISTKTRTRIEIDTVIKTWTKTNPCTRVDTKINPAAKTKVEEIVSFAIPALRNDFVAQDLTPSTSQ
jgi:hypothetical protein